MQVSDCILIVDDEPLNRELLEALLESEGYRTKSAASGPEALDMLGPNIDLILLDVNMPGMTGLDVARRVRNHPTFWDLPIIMVTALTSQSDRLQAAEAGANDFISKPLDQTELRIRMTSLLKLKHGQDAIKRHQMELEQKVEERTSELQAVVEQLEALATTDPLTCLPNHRSIIKSLDTEFERSDRFCRSCAVLFIDLDYFKILNDSWGHAAGDTALWEFGNVVRGCLRGMDAFGRWGGEEFVIVLPETNREAAMSCAERVRSAAASHVLAAAGGLHMTCSIGVAVYPNDGSDRLEMIRAADRAMYTAKRLGRNQVRSAIDPTISALEKNSDPCEAVVLQGEVAALAMLVAARDCYTGRHTTDVADLATKIAMRMGMNAQEAILVGLVGQLHDVGKVAVPDSVLQKPGALTDEEWVLMRQHPIVGADVVTHMPALSSIATSIRAHHERWDGNGYPDRIAGDAIPIAARIVAVADTFGAMTSDRPYRKACDVHEALAELRRCAGNQFDPDIVNIAHDLIVESCSRPSALVQ